MRTKPARRPMRLVGAALSRHRDWAGGVVLNPLDRRRGAEVFPRPVAERRDRCEAGSNYNNYKLKMATRKTPSWRMLTPGQRALLQRMQEEGGLFSLRPWEMSTVRSLLARGLVRPRLRGRHAGTRAGKPEGLWFLTALGLRTVPPAPQRHAEEEIETAP